MTPRQAKTIKQVCALPRDNVATDEHWILTGGYTVTIAAQRQGEAATGVVEMPRATFEAFIDWYETGEFRRPRRRVGRK